MFEHRYYHTLSHQINIVVKSRLKAISKTHAKKLTTFNSRQQKTERQEPKQIPKNVVHNFSSYTLSNDELVALSYGLDHQIPIRYNRNNITTEFEYFYQNLLNDISHIPEVQLSQVKTKLRDACGKYCRIKIPYKHRKTIENLSKRDGVIILKQDKGRGVVLMDKNKYTEKCMLLLNTKQFKKLDNDPTKTTEGKIQRMLRRIKPKLSEHEYKVLYPSGSSPGKFYGTAKIHKVPRNGNIDQLPIRPIVSNLNTATYQLAKHLSKILSPLRESEYTIKSTRHFMEIIKRKKVPEGFQMLSFDVNSLFLNVPLETTIDIILEEYTPTMN